jgi:tetratricopeptide (TPR) repeat protein
MQIHSKGIIIYVLAVASLCAAGFFVMLALSPGFRWHVARIVGDKVAEFKAPSARELERVLVDLTAKTTANPADQAAWIEKADALIKLGGYAEALDALDRATAIEPPSGRAYIMKSGALVDTYKLFNAVKVMEDAAAALPNDASVNLKLSELLLITGEAEGAYEHAKAAASLDPNNALAARRLGDSLVALGLYDEAVAAYGDALDINPGEPPFFDIGARTERGLVYYGMGQAYNALGRYDEALAACDAADKAVPNGGFSIDNRVYALTGKGAYGDAILKFQTNLGNWDIKKVATVYAYAVKKRGGKGDAERLASTLDVIFENAHGEQIIYAHAVKGDRDKVAELVGNTVSERPYMKRVIRSRIEMADMLDDPEIAGRLQVKPQSQGDT